MENLLLFDSVIPVQKLRGSASESGIAMLDLGFIETDAEVGVLSYLMRGNVRTVSLVLSSNISSKSAVRLRNLRQANTFLRTICMSHAKKFTDNDLSKYLDELAEGTEKCVHAEMNEL